MPDFCNSCSTFLHLPMRQPQRYSIIFAKTFYMRFSAPLVVFSVLTFFAVMSLSAGHKTPSGGYQPHSKPIMDEDKWVEQQLNKMSLDEKIGQSFMVACWSNKGESYLEAIAEQVSKDKIGGVIFFQGERGNLSEAINRFQQKADVPLLIGMDAEWGTAMRIFGEDRFPYAQTIGAANDPELTRKIAELMAVECDQMGIHINFAPDADVNSNPGNPVIGFRAFGSEPAHVSRHVEAFVKGIESQHVLSCIKHFPGHGDTDKDSHYELPTVSHTLAQFRSVDFVPFKKGIEAGTNAVMVAHLNVPTLDPSGTPSSLSEKVIQDYLRKELNFKGLVVSDALNMKAVADKYGKEEVVAKAYMAGCDVLLFPESVSDAIALIRKKVESGALKQTEVDARCRNVLRAKYRAIIAKPMIKRRDMSNDRQVACAQVYEKAMVVLKNEGNALPLDRLDRKIARVSVGTHALPFRESVDRYARITHYHYYTVKEALERMKGESFDQYDVIITDFHSNGQRAKDNYGFENWKDVVAMLPEKATVITSFFGNPSVLAPEKELPVNIDACIMAYENHSLTQDRVGQFIMGAFDVNGKLEITLNDTWKKGAGLKVNGNGRLKYTLPEELGISSAKMAEIDAIVENAIQAKALPGCQVVVAIQGKVIHQKSYGTTMYENSDSITNDHLYDIASITKIASSTAALMKLRSEGKFDVNDRLGELVPELVEGTPYADLNARDILTHQAGLTPWLAFYKSTIADGVLKPGIYSTTKKEGYMTPVADGIWIRDDYRKTVYKTIVETPLSGQKKYEYSDLGYYFWNAYIEKTTGQTQDKYVENAIYRPLGLQHMTYLPMRKFRLSQIVPTENDKEFRKQVIHGYVHDPGAAMMGGVAGHAGLFSNATDLAALMQVYLNKGQVGGFNLIDRNVIEQFTSCQFCPKNRRGLGFDKPAADGSGGPVSALTSLSSFGHSGFTGTLAWADPEYMVNFVFLSNRVYPSAENWKIRDMNIRTNIQRVIYEALAASKSGK